jgi:putative addiction module killer protein/probable addiction module antidote protein
MSEIRQTTEFLKWLSELKDRQARVRVQTRIYRLSLGLPGDVKPVREGVSEIRIDYGPGYRVYFCKKGETLIFLLAGGDKSTQEKDIRTALKLAHNL